VKFTDATPIRQPAPELPEKGFSVPYSEPEIRESNEKILASLRLLWDRRRMLFKVVLCGLLFSTLVAFLIPARYESTARLMPPDNQSASSLAMAAAAMSGAAAGLGGIASDVLGLKSTSDVFVGILNSRTVQDELIQQFDLKKLYRDRHMEDARKDLAKHTGISVDRRSEIISITVTDEIPQRAAAMAQAYVEELNRLVAELSTSSARRERLFLEGRLQSVSQDLEAAEKDFSRFASKNTAIDVKEQGKAMVEAAATLQGQLIAADSELQGLKQIYTDSNSRVRSLNARVDELKRQLDKLGGKGESMTEASDQPGDSLYPSIRKLPLLGVTYADLYRRTMIQEAVLESLTKEYEIAKVQEAKEIPTVKVLDAANVPDKESFPPRSLIIFLGALFACCFGVLYVLGSANWDAVDPRHPGKRFVTEVWVDLKAYAPWALKNGAGAAGENQRVLNEASQRGKQDDKQV
jgi:uncharacterized protein involved in exopolysaccharide biosynthesis